MRTTQASGLSASSHLRNAKAFFIAEGGNGLAAWFSLWEDYNSRDIRAVSKWAEQYRKSPLCVVTNSVSTISQYVGAIDRAVKKYGSLNKAKKAHEKWVAGERGYEFADISNFVKFAPEGQRAKNKAKSSKRAETKKALIAVGFTAHQAEWAMDICKVR